MTEVLYMEAQAVASPRQETSESKLGIREVRCKQHAGKGSPVSYPSGANSELAEAG